MRYSLGKSAGVRRTKAEGWENLNESTALLSVFSVLIEKEQL